LFPAYCFHCEERLEKVQQRLCAGCKEQLLLLKSEGRCLKCFGQIETLSGVCHSCRKTSHAHKRAAACFEKVGAAASLHRQFAQGRLFLAKDLAALMILQLEQLNWPEPTLVTHVPLPLEERLWQGFDPSKELASLLGKWMNVPTKKALLKNEIVLLIEDRMSQLFSHAETLLESAPAAIYGLAFLAQD